MNEFTAALFVAVPPLEKRYKSTMVRTAAQLGKRLRREHPLKMFAKNGNGFPFAGEANEQVIQPMPGGLSPFSAPLLAVLPSEIFPDDRRDNEQRGSDVDEITPRRALVRVR
jgi:hypothetical protein